MSEDTLFPAAPDEAVLVQAAKSGDDTAFEQLVANYICWFQKFLSTREATRPTHATTSELRGVLLHALHDAVQQFDATRQARFVTLLLWKTRARYKTLCREEPQHQRRMQRVRLLMAPLLDHAHWPEPSDDAQRDRLDKLHAAIRRLPEDDQYILRMRSNRWTYKAIGQKLAPARTSETVRTRFKNLCLHLQPQVRVP